MRIFINNVNSYTGAALARALREGDGYLNRLFGTAEGIEVTPQQEAEAAAAAAAASNNNESSSSSMQQHVAVPSCIRRVISKRNPQQLLQNILSCSLAVFDLHSSSPDEIEIILKRIKTAEIKKPLTIILISSVLTWGATPKQYSSSGSGSSGSNSNSSGSSSSDGAAQEADDAAAAAQQQQQEDGEEYVEEEEVEASEEEESKTENDSSSNSNSATTPSSPTSSSSSSSSTSQRSSRTSGSSSTGRCRVPLPFSQDHYELRVPLRKYVKWKTIETLLLSLNYKENLKGIIVSCGLLYGKGEEILYDLFKAAWLGLQTHVTIGRGSNYVPCIHVDDLCNLVRSIGIEGKGEEDVYHLAVDSSLVTQKEIIEAIVEELGVSFTLPESSKEAAALLMQQQADTLLLHCCFKPSPLMLKPSFKWRAKEGFVVNIKQTAKEFCTARGLKQIRVLVTGPPGSGKTVLSQLLAEHLNICCLQLQQQQQGQLQQSGSKNREGDGLSSPSASDEQKRKGKKGSAGSSTTGAAAAAAAAAATGAPASAGGGSRKGRLSPSVCFKQLKINLNKNVCRYRGFILDGVVNNYDECKQLFLPPLRDPEEPTAEPDPDAAAAGDTPAGAAGDNEEGGAKQSPSSGAAGGAAAAAAPFLPEFVINLHAAAEVCEKRVMQLPPAAVVPGINDREGFKKRMQTYAHLNENTEGKPRLTDFFQELGIEVLELPAEGDLQEMLSSCLIYLSRKGKIKNFVVDSDTWLLQQQQQQEEREAAAAAAAAAEQQQQQQLQQQQMEKQRARDLTRLRHIEAHEQQLLLLRSLPLRRYLMHSVLPSLSEGLLEVCRVLPEDPISYLAEFLFARARQLQ